MTGMLSQFGVVKGTVYGTPNTVTRFFETNDPVVIKPDYGRARSTALRSGSRAVQSTKFVPYLTGGTTTVEMPVPTKGFGIFLEPMLGTVATGTVADSNYTHTGTVGSLLGDFLDAQTGNPFAGSATVQPFTGEGGKIASWELSCDLDGLLMASFDFDFEDVSTAVALATPSYTANATVFGFNKAAITVDGVEICLKNFTCGMDNGFDVNRRFLCGNGLKKEPLENEMRNITWSGDAEFTSLSMYNKYVAATASGTLGAIVATFTGPIIHAGATYPELKITIPAAEFDSVEVGSSGPATLTQSLSGIGTDDLTNSPITIAYKTNDVTP